MIRRLSVALLVSLATSAWAHPVMDAIKLVDQEKLKQLPHRMEETTVRNGTTNKLVGLYAPGASDGQRWTLESVNGKAPSAKDLNAFRNRHAAAEPKLSEQIDPASLAPLDGVNSRRWSFRFKDGLSVDGVSMEQFRGVVTLEEGGSVAAIDLNLLQPVRVKFIVKINALRQHTSYVRRPNGDVIESANSLDMDISAAGFAVHQVSNYTFELLKPGSGT